MTDNFKQNGQIKWADINEIKTTLDGKANNASVVHLTGDTMTGTLNANINSSGTSYKVYGAVAN